MPETPVQSVDQRYGLIVQQPGRAQQLLVRSLMMILNYRYGLDLIVADSFVEAFSAIRQHRGRICCTFIVHNKKIDSVTSISGLNLEGEVPLCLILPGSLVPSHQVLCHRMKKVFFCSWQSAFGHTSASLPRTIESAFEQHGIEELLSDLEHVPYEEAQVRIARRLKTLNTLPTLPEVALRIMRMADDPQSTVEDLEEVLISDPAVVHRLLQVVNSPVFAGVGHRERWSLQEAIVRLGRRKVGAIAHQIKLMNGLLKPDESLFDMRRFWEHSVGCALIADRLYTRGMVPLTEVLEFNDYWIAGVLHDAGKLVLGFFFWNHFEAVLSHMAQNEHSFREAEKELGDVANHEYLGQLLLIKSSVGPALVEAGGTHHTTGQAPGDLACLLHLANNICTDLGLGYAADERSVYSGAVLRALRLDMEDVRGLRETLGQPMVQEVAEVVDRCAQPP